MVFFFLMKLILMKTVKKTKYVLPVLYYLSTGNFRFYLLFLVLIFFYDIPWYQQVTCIQRMYVDRIADPALISVENIIVEFFFYVLLLDANTNRRTARLGLGRISS